MKINFLVRAKNKNFWLAFIPSLFLLIQVIANLFGTDITLAGYSDKVIEVVNAVFAVLAILGIVNDPTTKGLSDSDRALEYTEPN